MISLQTNTDSLNAQQNLDVNHAFESKTIEQLTSGYRINSSADDAAGLVIANSYRSGVSELSQGINNANNGVSQLQIVDGGLSNISTILDRMKTLATESASQTFTGNRSVLNQEYTQLLTEITRQATNINLNAGGSFNTQLNVYIGGANTASNSEVNVDLSGTKNAVDAVSLGLSSSTVLGGGASITGNTLNLNSPSNATFVKSTGAGATDNQVFTFNLADSTGATKQVQATVAATPNGSTLNQILTSLNTQLNPSGIDAAVDSNGALQFSGATAFTVSDNAAQKPTAIAGLGAPPAVTTKSTGTSLLTNEVSASPTDITTGTADNSSNYLYDGATTYTAPSIGSSESLTFTNLAGYSFSAKLTNATTGANAGDTLAHALASINAQTASYGVYAVANASGTGISFQSAQAFSINDVSTASAAVPTNTGTGLTNFTANQSTLVAVGSNAAAPSTGQFATGGPQDLSGSAYANVLKNSTDAQQFTFTINGVDGGTPVAVNISNADLHGTGTNVTDGASLMAAIQAKLDLTLSAADPAHYTAGDIKAGFDTAGNLAFSSSATATHPNVLFSVEDNGATTSGSTFVTTGGDTGLTSTAFGAPLTGLNNQAQTLNAAYTVNTATSTVLTVGGLALTIASNTNVANAAKSINAQLAAGGNTNIFATLNAAATGIDLQSINKFNAGGSTLSATGSGAYLDATAHSGDKQTFTFHLAGQPAGIDLVIPGTPGGYTSPAAVVSAINTLIGTAAYASLNVAGIQVSLDANGALRFTSPLKAFTVTDKNDAAGDGLTSYAVGNTDFTGVNTQAASAANFTANKSAFTAVGSNPATPIAGQFATSGPQALTGSAYVNVLSGVNDAQQFLFTIKGVNGGAAIPITFAHTDVQNPGITSSATLLSALQIKLDTTLSAADPANYSAGDIAVGFDSAGNIAFSSSPTATHPNALFSITDKGPTTSGGPFTSSTTEIGLTSNASNGTTVGVNNQAQTLDASYTLNPAITTVTVGTMALTTAGNTTLASAIASINTQLVAAGNTSVFATLDNAGTGINFQSINKFNAGGTTLSSIGTPGFLDTTANPADKQTFTFTVPGQPSPISLVVNGIPGGYSNGAAAVSAISAELLTAPYALLSAAGITASLNNGALQFSSTTSDFTVIDHHDSLGDGLTAYAAGNTNFTAANIHESVGTFSQAYTVPPTDTTLTVGTTNVALAADDSIQQAVAKINSALLTAGNINTIATVDSNGTSILYEVSGAGNSSITLGGASPGTVFANSTSAAVKYQAVLGTGDGITSTANADSAINAINSAILSLGLVQGSIGAGENKLQYAITLAQSQISNFSAAESQLRDTDVAAQAANLTKSQVLTQTTIAAMAQANSEPQSVLKLLQ